MDKMTGQKVLTQEEAAYLGELLELHGDVAYIVRGNKVVQLAAAELEELKQAAELSEQERELLELYRGLKSNERRSVDSFIKGLSMDE